MLYEIIVEHIENTQWSPIIIYKIRFPQFSRQKELSNHIFFLVFYNDATI